jgi:hypothetical protein
MRTKEKVIEHLDQIIQSCRDVKADDKVHEDAKSLASLVIRDCNLLKRKIDPEYLMLVAE